MPRSVHPATIGPGPRLFLVAATVLFVELLLIRWIPANVIYVGYFTNFILIGSFLGIGLGILLGRRRTWPSPRTFSARWSEVCWSTARS